MRSVEVVEIASEKAVTSLALHQFYSQQTPSLLLVAGQHGRELTPIFVATRLINMLEESGICGGRIGIIPIANLPGVVAGTRENPVDGRDINRCYREQPQSTFSEAIAAEVLKIAADYDIVVDLHAAGRARYLPHVIIHRAEDAELAIVFDLDFVITRKNSADESGSGLTRYLAACGRQALALELGAGEIVRDADVSSGLNALARLLRHLGMYPPAEKSLELPKRQTLEQQIYSHDVRKIIKAEYDMLAYWQIELGTEVAKGTPLGCSIRVDKPDEPADIVSAPLSGKIIYLRDRSLVRKGETLFMLIPDSPHHTIGGDMRG